jgi:thiol-disulfide isomerase/thioredoxin
MKARHVAIMALALSCLGAGLFAGLRHWSPDLAQPGASAGFFNQSLPDLSNSAQPMRQWQGKTVIINFWATWCAPCVEEMPELSALQKEIGMLNMQILGIGIDSPANIRDFSAKHQIAYPLYLAGMGGSDLARAFGNDAGGLPFTVLLAPDGTVKKTYLGRLKFKELRKDLGLRPKSS